MATKRKKVLVRGRILSAARGNFDWQLTDDVKALLAAHDDHTKVRKGRPASDIEVFKRAALVMVVSGWESYIEDTLENGFIPAVNLAKNPKDLGFAFNAVAQAWLESSPKPPDLAIWCGNGWKDQLKSRIAEEIAALHTPDSKNVKRLTKRYLGQDVTQNWKWRGVAPAQACKMLDDLIKLRGKLVHRAREWPRRSGRKADVTRKNVVDGFSLIERLVECTDLALGIEPRSYVRETYR